MSTTPEINDNDETDWRAALLSRVGIVVVVLLALGGAAAVISANRSDALRALGLALMMSSAILFAILSIRRLSTRIKSIVIVATLGAGSVASYTIVGYLPGGTVTAAFVLILAALLIGRKTFIAVLVAYTLLVITLTVLVATDTWQGPNLVSIDPGDPTNWVRTSLMSVILWTSLSFSVLFVVDTVEENLARRRAALDNLREEVRERQAAESAQREAEEVANQAQKMEAVGQLAAGIAHDFNNALLVIRGWNEIRGFSDANDEQRHATAAVDQAVEDTAQLSRQILTFARKDTRAPKYLYLGRFVEGAMRSLQRVAGSNIKVKFDVEADALVHVDESQIQQLILNLVINARDAIDGDGNIRISVGPAAADDVTTFSAETDQWVVLQVEDDGPGIDEEMQPHVFVPFFTTKARDKGTGLGLSTVHGIVQQSNGHIRLQSRPGRTLFSIFLPSANTEQFEDTDSYELSETIEINLRILVIENDPLAREMIVAAIKRAGNETVECDNGDAVLSILKDDETPYDVLCLDAVFPGAPLVDVIEAFERHSPDAKVLVCSGYVKEELAIRKLESSEYAYLAKPFTGNRLIRKIHKITGGTTQSG